MKTYRNFVSDSSRWEGFEFRDDDIVISTPAKCGTTWMQMLCALLIFDDVELPAPLTTLSPWLDMQTARIEDVRAALEAQTHRRFIKTHTPLDGLPWDSRVTYIGVGRDPRDAGLSWDNHARNMNIAAFVTARAGAVGMDDAGEFFPDGPPPAPPEEPIDRFLAWVDDESSAMSGLAGVVGHLTTFWERRGEPNVALFHYADMKADLTREMSALAAILDISVEPSRLPILVEAATFARMKQKAEYLAPESGYLWEDTARFFDKSRHGGWRDLPAHVLDHYDRRVAALAPPDLVAWLHR